MTQNSDRQKTEEVGADAFVTKPVSLTNLAEKVEELLNNN